MAIEGVRGHARCGHLRMGRDMRLRGNCHAVRRRDLGDLDPPIRATGVAAGPAMIELLRRWIEHRRAIRRRWQEDARRLAAVDPVNAYYEAQRRATRSRAQGNSRDYWHWTKVASEVARTACRDGLRGRQFDCRSGNNRLSLKACGVLLCQLSTQAFQALGESHIWGVGSIPFKSKAMTASGQDQQPMYGEYGPLTAMLLRKNGAHGN